MSDTLEPDHILPMGAGLAAVAPQLIYIEAKRQYEALLRMRDSPTNDSTTTRVTRQQTDLSLYYRNLWEIATRNLDELQKIRLRHVCFAYKSRKQVLQFLELLDGEFEWAVELRGCVEECGWDSGFEEDGVRENSTVQDLSSTSTAPRLEGALTESSSNKLFESEHLSPRRQQRNYFIIPTLPIALPTAFCSALGSQGAIDRLTASHILAHPAALLLNLSPGLKSLLRDNLPDFWKDIRTTPPRLPTPDPASCRASISLEKHQEEGEWIALFEHLLAGQHRLVQCNGEEIEVADEDEGYGLTDLGIWIAGWLGVRQGALDTKMKGGVGKRKVEKKRKRTRTKLSVVGGARAHEDGRGTASTRDDLTDVDGQDEAIGEDDREELGVRSRRRKRVSWYDEYPKVFFADQNKGEDGHGVVARSEG